MPPPARAPQQPVGDYFNLLPTPNPSEVMFRVKQPGAIFKSTQMPALGTPFNQCDILSVKSAVQLQGYGSYVYVMCRRDKENMWFYFGKSRTQAERDTPFRTYYTKQNHPWDAVLEDVYPVRSVKPTTDILSDNTKIPTVEPVYQIRYKYRPAVTVNSLVRVDLYLSEVPWDQAKFRHEQPIPTDVQGSFGGLDVSFPRCLHGTVTFPEALAGAQVVSGVGMVNPPPGRNPSKMVFPATNFTDWQPYVLDDEQEPVDGMYLRQKKTIYPPTQPEVVIT
jgi:hypothetical protein